MGNCRFKLADMMPYSWFYKLRHMGSRGRGGNKGCRGQVVQNYMKKSRAPTTPASYSIGTERPSPPPPSSPTKPLCLTNRPSYYVSSEDRADDNPNSPTHSKALYTLFPLDTPRKSKKKARNKSLITSTRLIPTDVSPACPSRNQSSPVSKNSEFHVSQSLMNSQSSRVTLAATDTTNDIGMDQSNFNVISKRELHPIMTKPNMKKDNKSELDDINLTSKQGNLLGQNNTRKSTHAHHGAKIRMNSPRLAKKRVQALTAGKIAGDTKRKEGLKESIAVVKSSSNPQKDFMESMVEMIVENNLLASKDLEDLLACYLSLNSHEYHNMIVEVFEQIWIALTEITL